jgi:nucleoside diphosphate kinase
LSVRMDTRREQAGGEPEVWRSLAYLLLKPDVVLRGITCEVLNVLADAGFGAVEFRIGSLPEALFSQMYQSTFRWDLDHWAFNRELYKYGPVIGLLLRQAPALGNAESPQECLKAFKGSALPENLAAGSLRGRLGASSRIFNVVHVPDGIDSARRDAACWFGEGFIERMPVAQQLGAAFVPLEAEVVRHGYLAANCLDGEAVYFFVMVRLLHAIEKELRFRGTALEILRRASASYHSGAAALIRSASDLDARREIVERSLAHARAVLTGEDLGSAVAGSDHRLLLEQTLDVVLSLESHGAFGGWRLEFFWHLLDQWKVFTSDLERYLVAGVFTYPSLMPFHRGSAS